MKVKELIEMLKEMSEDADVEVIADNGPYRKIVDVEQEYSDLVSIGVTEAGE